MDSGRSLRILFTNNTLAYRAGSELFVFDLAVALRKRGHQPIAFSTVLGDVADQLRSAAIPVIDDLGSLAVPPDIIHGQHHLELATTLLRFPQTPAIHVCHGWLPWEEAPLRFPTIQKYIAVSNLTRERLLTSGIRPDLVEVVPNFVDTERFAPRGRLTGLPATAAVFSNYLSPGHPHYLAIRAACTQLQFERIDLLGSTAGTALVKPEEALPGYDLIFAAGRCALEALASGCAVIVADHHGFAGLVTLDNLETLRSGNFGIATTYGNPTTPERVAAETAKITPSEVEAVSRTVRAKASLSSAVSVWERIYLDALTTHNPSSALNQLTLAASDYLRELNPIIKNRHTEWSSLVTRSAADTQKISSVEAALAEARGNASALMAKVDDQDALLGEARTTIATLEAAVASAEDRASKLGRALDERIRQHTRVQERIVALDASVAEAEGRSATIRAILNERAAQLTQAQSRIAALESAGVQAEQRVSEVGGSLDKTTADLAAARKRNAAIEVSLAERERELALANRRVARIKASLSYRLAAPFRELYRPVRGLQASHLAKKLRAAWRYPLSSHKRKLFRAGYEQPTPLPSAPDARPPKAVARLHALARYPFSPRLRRAYRERLRNPATPPLTAGPPFANAASSLGPTQPDLRHDSTIIRESGLFDTRWYLENYGDVRRAMVDPIGHYLLHGAHEGRDPSSTFSTRGYLVANPDLRPGDVNPLLHYIQYGKPENPVHLKRCYRESCSSKLSDFLASGERIKLRSSDKPEVSIIIVLFNGAELTLENLLALQNALNIPCEVIIVDNASTDRTHELLARVDGARTIFNQSNLHFLRAVNQGARAAKGKSILLLNNDTRPKADSVTIAARLLDQDPSIGAVGGKIILLDGTLQEAGSIVWRDGSCAGYGRGRKPYDAEFEFRRDVDYCSGAFLMLRRSLFTELGGFDERFAPAYYEETDFCMRLWAAGHRVVYEPTIEIVHFEFGSSASSDAAIALQARNHEIFGSVHHERLQRHHPAGTNEILARDRSQTRRILVIDDQVPFPELGAGFPRAADLIRAIHAAGWQVTFYPLRHPDVDFSLTRTVFPPEMELVANSGLKGLTDFLRERGQFFDAVMVSRPHNMEDVRRAFGQVPGLRGSLPVIYDAEALFSEREALRCKVFGLARDEVRHGEELSKEVALALGAAAVIAVSNREAELIARRIPSKVYVVAHKRTPTPRTAPWEKRRDILFVGSLSGSRQISPNIDGLYWFIEEVMPILDGELGMDYRLIVAGRYESDEVRALGNSRVAILGMVDDLEDLYTRSKVFIAPTRFAAGLPYKVHEASAEGIPIVATELIATQADRVHGKNILVGNDAQAFADCCARLYRDRALWEQVRAGALASVTRECAPDRFDATLARLLADVSVKRF